MRHLNTVNILFIVTGAFGLLLTVLASPKNRRAGRRVYWAGCLIATISAFFIAYPPDWKTGILLSLFVSGMTVFTAYAYTPHIKIRGKIYAFSVEDSQPDPSPDGVSPPRGGNRDYDPAPDAYAGLGLATAKKFWWLLVFIMAMCALGVAEYFHFRASPWSLASAVGIIVLLAFGFGYATDASWGYPIARGQYLQFVIISVVTFGVFTVFYLGGYYAGKRWPWRNKRSLEYRVHPRHQKRWP
ncbi:MAG: hypothetical protein QJR12_12275 [Mycobacterium sp.]|uniref:hypothetical protein n=1 Tax=Mycobacterium sp. TaxID=1785 RepID=UPI0026167B22|nr:hypothetical protein [Mycobacterium sp.]MDI3315004.1 hypothetical protein [Mycobacterium sp.]